MNEYLQKLLGEFNAKTAENTTLLAKGDSMTAEDVTKVQENNTALKGLQTQIESAKTTLKDSDDLKKWFSDPTLNIQSLIGKGGAQILGMQPAGETQITKTADTIEIEGYGEGVISEKQWAAICEPSYLKVHERYLRQKGVVDDYDRKALSEGSDPAGGYLVPPQTLARLIEKKAAPARLAGLVERIPCSSNQININAVNYTTDDIYTTGMRTTFTGEIPSSSTVHNVTDPVFAQKTIQIGTWMMSLPMYNDFIEDSAIPILSWVTNKFLETRDLHYDNQIINGTGVGARPHGINKNPGGTDEPAAVVSSTADNIDAAQLRGIIYELPEQYLDGAVFSFNRASVHKAIAQMAGATGEFIFRLGEYDNGIGQRHPDTLGGYPIVNSAFWSNIAASTNVGMFGDPRGYWLAERTAMSVEVLREVNYLSNQTVVAGRLRFGGIVAEPFRIKVIRSDNA